ncbi:MAG: hypothetical protein RSC67_01600 [Carnobacterium sp.]|uniref:hypothetical protein n=1 Tax=Carnobacterium sp. TaxID=48221 RepID=UPI002FC7F323
MTETAKERIYRKTLENTRDRLDGFEEQYANKEVYSAFDELTGLVEKGLKEASEIHGSTDKLSVEKLQEQLNTAKKALTEIDRSRYGMQFRRDRNPNVARQALAAIGNEGSGDE